MATKNVVWDRGIDSLIPNKVNVNKESEIIKVNADSEKKDGIFVNINKVEPNREQPRKILMKIH